MPIRAFVSIFLLALSAWAQAPAHKAATPTHAAGPTKVTGDGTKTSSGLQYWDITVGTGEEAKVGDKVKVHYTGWLDSGKKFDSTAGAKPYEFTLGQGNVIKGWDEGIAGMKVGGKRQLRIPPELGYGEDGHAPQVPPNATLIFDVRLVSVTPAAN